MLTTSHLIYGWAAAKATEATPDRQRTLAFVIGSALPDLPTYLFFLVHTVMLGTTQRELWNTLYFDSAWTPIITLSHSLILWPLAVAAGLLLRQRLLLYLASAATLHIGLDFFVHNDDAYRHFWPLSDWQFTSPVSYWDTDHYGAIVGSLDAVVLLGLLGWLYTRYQSRRARLAIGGLVSVVVGSLLLPLLLF